MIQEEKQLLLKDLCARLPYGLICRTNKGKGTLISAECSFGENLVYVDFGYQQAEEFDLNEDDEVKPYLRPMSSMTLVERIELKAITKGAIQTIGLEDIVVTTDKGFDYLNTHHIDYRGLIEKGLALEAPKDMYKDE